MHGFVQKGTRMPEADAWRFFIQSLLALSYVHSKHVIHRDMKSLNVFFDSKKNIKIGDFGIACSLSYNSEYARTIVGTPFYLSPELCDDKPYNEKSDIWALGGTEVRSVDISFNQTTFHVCPYPVATFQLTNAVVRSIDHCDIHVASRRSSLSNAN